MRGAVRGDGGGGEGGASSGEIERAAIDCAIVAKGGSVIGEGYISSGGDSPPFAADGVVAAEAAVLKLERTGALVNGAAILQGDIGAKGAVADYQRAADADGAAGSGEVG